MAFFLPSYSMPYLEAHSWTVGRFIHGPLGKVRTIIRPFFSGISAIECMKVTNSFLLIDPWWFYYKAVNLCTGDPQPTGFLHWHLQQWLECHCFPILHCHSGSTWNGFYLILQWNTHLPPHTHIDKHTHRLFHFSTTGFRNWICFEHPPQYCLSFLHSVTLSCLILMETKLNHSLCT